MHILFVTFGDLLTTGGSLRPVSILRALADAGHRVDVIARRADIPEHPQIRILKGGGGAEQPRRRLRMAILKAAGKSGYDALHAVDDAALFVSRISRLRKRRLVYDASRCFSGPHGSPPNRLWKMVPRHLEQCEKRLLQRASAVLTACSALKADLRALDPGASLVQIEDIPAQALYRSGTDGAAGLLSRFDGKTSSVVVCSLLPESQKELRTLLVGVRKVIESVPDAAFFFKGGLAAEGESLAANLDIQKRCSFFRTDETREFLSALDIADAALLVPQASCRYVHSEVFTLLNAPAPLVVVQNPAYENILNEQNCIPALPSSQGIAEGLLRAIKEPLFSLSIGVEGQQLIADSYSFSSFKHKVRMAYHEVFNGG